MKIILIFLNLALCHPLFSRNLFRTHSDLSDYVDYGVKRSWEPQYSEYFNDQKPETKLFIFDTKRPLAVEKTLIAQHVPIEKMPLMPQNYIAAPVKDKKPLWLSQYIGDSLFRFG